MKWIAIILSIYLITLSSMPCADLEVNSSVHKTAQFSSEENHSHDKQNDLCSPFCTCNCCGAQVLSYQANIVFGLSTIPAVIIKALPTYKSILYSNFFGSIWQPPQIA
ncbi:DUF6660 family protein [Flavobacterium sp. WC2509]|uniref:DUF6660 family protein n=1 Tax=Flavobacterium sp. WC2509 TaxID=3461406 RepID=UPI004044C285